MSGNLRGSGVLGGDRSGTGKII